MPTKAKKRSIGKKSSKRKAAVKRTKENAAVRNISSPDETRTFDKGRVDLVNVGKATIGKISLEPGWKWSESVKPIVKTKSCEMPHTQYAISGRIHIKMDDGSEFEIGPGDAAYIPPGHDAWVVGDEPFVGVDVTGLKEYAKS